MASNVVFNGVTYSVPSVGDSGWGTDLTAYFISIASNSFQKTGGTFTLTAEANFGATYGLKSAYLKSQATNPASAGIIRLGNTESISFRNAANSADKSLTVDASDNLTYGGTKLLISGSIVNADVNAAAAIVYSKLSLSNSIVNADINSSAAITYSKLSLSGGILNADINASAAIAYSKLNLATSILNADINAAAAIAYSKLNLAASILNADISASAAIARSKFAALTASRLMVTDGSGFDSVSSVTATEAGYLSGVTSPIQTQINSVLTNPMTTAGDIIYGGASGVATRLANGTSGQYLKSAGGTAAPVWTTFTRPTIQKFTSGSGTYTTPANVVWIRVEMVGGGSGGGGAGSSGTNAGAGGNTTFGSTVVVANGAAANSSGVAGAGGTASLGAGAVGLAFSGGTGQGGQSSITNGVNIMGPMGAASPFGGAGGGGQAGSGGSAAAANTGSGGGAGTSFNRSVATFGAGGSAGGYAKAIIVSPSATYAYAVGSGGAGGATGGDSAGGAGGSGIIIVEEFYV